MCIKTRCELQKRNPGNPTVFMDPKPFGSLCRINWPRRTVALDVTVLRGGWVELGSAIILWLTNRVAENRGVTSRLNLISPIEQQFLIHGKP